MCTCQPLIAERASVLRMRDIEYNETPLYGDNTDYTTFIKTEQATYLYCHI